jgi:hypothetical protein
LVGTNAHLGSAYRQVVRTLAWQRRATGVAVEAERPSYVLEALGPVPASTRGRRAWRQAAAQIEDYRRSYHITEAEAEGVAVQPDGRSHMASGLSLSTRGQGGIPGWPAITVSAEVCCGQGTKTSLPRTWPDWLMR